MLLACILLCVSNASFLGGLARSKLCLLDLALSLSESVIESFCQLPAHHEYPRWWSHRSGQSMRSASALYGYRASWTLTRLKLVKVWMQIPIESWNSTPQSRFLSNAASPATSLGSFVSEPSHCRIAPSPGVIHRLGRYKGTLRTCMLTIAVIYLEGSQQTLRLACLKRHKSEGGRLVCQIGLTRPVAANPSSYFFTARSRPRVVGSCCVVRHRRLLWVHSSISSGSTYIIPTNHTSPF